jgi:hypothetical protein
VHLRQLPTVLHQQATYQLLRHRDLDFNRQNTLTGLRVSFKMDNKWRTY